MIPLKATPQGGSTLDYFLRLLSLRREEAPKALLMALYFFLAMTCGSIVKSLQLALYLSKVGFDWRLPSLYAVVALICGLIVFLYRYLARRYSNLDLASGTLGFFQLSIVLFWFLVAREQFWVYLAFYIWGGIFCLLVPTLGWFIAFDLYTTREAKRLFALFGTGGILGGAFGGYYTALVAGTLGASGLLVHVFVLLLVLQGVLLAIHRSTGSRVELRHHAPRFDTYKPSRSTPSGLTGLFGSRYFASLAGMVLLCAFTTTLIDLQYQWFLEQRYPGSEMQITQFVSALLGIMYSFSALLQLFATSRLLAHLGVGTTLLVLPLALLGGSVGTLILAGFTAAVALKAIDGFLRPSLYRIGLEVLYVPFSSPHTITLKSFIDLVVFRLGDALGAAAFLGVSLILVTPVEIIQATILLAAALWVFLTLQLRQQYVNRLRYSLEHGPAKVWPSSFMLEAAGAQEALQAALKSDNPSKLSFALQQLAAVDLQNEEEQVMDVSASAEEIMHTHISGVHRVRHLWLNTVAHLVDHSDPQIGAVAFHLLVRHDPAKYSGRLRKKFDSKSIPEVIYLYYLDRYIEHPDPYLQFSQVMNWCQSPGPEEASILARLMGKTRNRAFLPMLRQWMSGLPGEPARAAIEALGQYAEPRLLVPLISLLGSHWSRQAARKALINYGESAVSQLLEILRNPAIGSSVKQQIPHILSRIGTSSSREGLVSALYSPDPAVSYNSLKGLNQLRASHDFSYSQQTFLPLLQIWAKQYYELVNIESIPNKPEDKAWKLLRKTNHERIDWTIEKIFRGLELFFPRGEAYLSYLGYTGNKKGLRENAIELIDARIKGELRKTLLPIFSQDSPPKLARRGQALFGLPSDPDAILLDALLELDPWLRCCILAALREQPRPIVERAIRQACQDIDPLVRESAQWALTGMKGADERKVRRPTVEKVLLLQDVGILSFASTDQLAQLASLCQAKSYQANETLFRKGEPHTKLFLLVEGRISLESEANPETVEKCALDFWSCLAQSAHEVSAKCVDDCTVLLVSFEDLVSLLSTEPELSWAILKSLASSRPKA